MSILTSLGSGSGIDTAQLISDLVAAQRAPSDSVLKTRQTDVEAKISSLSQVSSALGAFSTALGSLVGSGALDRQTTSSDATTIAVSPSGTGEPTGISSAIEVQQLAQRQTIASTPVANKNAAIGQGTLTINFGTVSGTVPAPSGFSASSRAPVTITIGPDNDSLVGLQQAINASNSGLTASIVQDASGARLVIKGETGKEQGFTIDGSAGLEAFEFGPGTSGMSWSTAAQNSILAVDGITVERATNSVTDLIDGVKLDLLKADPGAAVTVSSNYDTATLKTAVGNYVDVYNQLVQMLADATKMATDGGTAGPLASDRTIRELKRTLSDLSSKTLLTGAGPSSLAEIGIKTNRDGTLAIDDAKLTTAVSQYPERVHDMFVPGQSSSSPLIGIASGLGAAKPGSYAVTNVVPATSGRLTGAAVPAAFGAPVVIDSTNKSFGVTLDGRNSLSINLPEGSYATGADLAAAFQSAINADPVFGSFGLALDVSWDGSSLAFQSRSVGSTSSVVLTGLNPALSTTLGLDATTANIGVNASGKIAGVAAIGIGNRLIASSQSSAAGLAVNVLGGVTTATITVRQTVSGTISDLQAQLSASGGGLNAASARLAKEAAAIAEEQAKVDASSAALKDRLTTQFAAMEKAVAAFKSTQSYMQQQIDMWTKSNN